MPGGNPADLASMPVAPGLAPNPLDVGTVFGGVMKHLRPAGCNTGTSSNATVHGATSQG